MAGRRRRWRGRRRSRSVDRVAPWYRALSPLFLINPALRRKAVAAMDCGPATRRLRSASAAAATSLLLDASDRVGRWSDRPLGRDAGRGRKLVAKRGATNVDLIEAAPRRSSSTASSTPPLQPQLLGDPRGGALGGARPRLGPARPAAGWWSSTAACPAPPAAPDRADCPPTDQARPGDPDTNPGTPRPLRRGRHRTGLLDIYFV